MKAENINSFYMATNKVFKLMLNLETSMGQAKLSGEIDENDNLGVLLKIFGDLEGNVFFVFPNDVVLKMVKIMSGMDIDEVEVFATSAISEVVNIISGNAATILSENDKVCDISTPEIYLEGINEILRSENLLSIPIKTDIGEFELNIRLS